MVRTSVASDFAAAVWIRHNAPVGHTRTTDQNSVVGDDVVEPSDHGTDVAIGIDIGGTQVSGGLVTRDGLITARSRRHPPHRSRSLRVVDNTIVKVVEELTGQLGPTQTLSAVGIGAAGFVSVDGGTVVFAPHLSWRNEPLRDSLSARLDLPVHLENDANAACWAEVRFGVTRGHPHVVMITLGTGIGGALVEPARRTVERTLTGRGYRPLADLRTARLGNDAGLIGAADLARLELS